MRWAGYALWQDRESDKKFERDLLSCVHCQFQWYVVPGSGNQRGWCSMCSGPVCGKPKCRECTPFMKKLEEEENRQRLFKEIGI